MNSSRFGVYLGLRPHGEEQVLGDRILVASDDSEEGRYATEVASRLRGEHAAPLAILRVDQFAPSAAPGGSSPGTLAGWLERQPRSATSWIAQGVPGIEISRFGDRHRASLIVLGRRDRAGRQPASLGETADAVVRRAGIPVLSVPKGSWPFRRGLVALDETPRSHQVLDLALRWSREIDLPLVGVTVTQNGAGATRRSVAVAASAAGMAGTPPAIQVSLRTGSPAVEILEEVCAAEAGVLVIGYRRGGPPKVVEPTETARSLLLAAPCAVLTVPL